MELGQGAQDCSSLSFGDGLTVVAVVTVVQIVENVDLVGQLRKIVGMWVEWLM